MKKLLTLALGLTLGYLVGKHGKEIAESLNIQTEAAPSCPLPPKKKDISELSVLAADKLLQGAKRLKELATLIPATAEGRKNALKGFLANATKRKEHAQANPSPR
jgi:hypothetical protein